MSEVEEPILVDMVEDRNLWTLVSDVQYLAGGVFTAVQFLCGISYLTGKYFVGWLSWILLGTWDCFCASADGLKCLFEAVIELEKSIIRGILLTRYGIDMLFEAFQVTIFDLLNFGQRTVESIVSAITSGINMCSNALSALVFTVPQDICTTLSLIGDSTIDMVTLLVMFMRDFLMKLIWSPIYVIITAGQCGLFVLGLPGRILTAIPWSAHVGSAVLVLVYIVYCKLSIFRFVQLIMTLCQYIIHTISGLPSFLRRLFHLRPSVSTALDGSDNYNSAGKGMCVVCFEKQVDFLAHPCNHLCLCSDCAHLLVEYDPRCPICRLRVEHYSRVYVS